MSGEELREKIDEYCRSQKACEVCIFYEAIDKGFLCGSSSVDRLTDFKALNRFKKEILEEEKENKE